MTVPENRGQKRAASLLGSDLYDPQVCMRVKDGNFLWMVLLTKVIEWELSQ